MTESLLALLETSLSAEFGVNPRIASLATVDEDGHPHVRSVVVRRIDAGGLWIAADARSAKIEHLAHQPRAELAFGLPARREQFRVAGIVRICAADDPSPHRESLWRSLTDPSRALFHWPSPGATLADDVSAFPASVRSDEPVPRTFAVIQLAPDLVEHLELSPHPHRRRRWRSTNGWRLENVNP